MTHILSIAAMIAACVSPTPAPTLAPQAAGQEVTCSPVAVAKPLPEDPFLRVAARAVRGDFPDAKAWQLAAYRNMLANGYQRRTFVLTAYHPGEGRQGQVDCRGEPCVRGVLACNRLPYGTAVYLPSFARMFIVRDRGSRANDRKAARIGGTWADVWLADPDEADGRCDWSPSEGAVVAHD